MSTTGETESPSGWDRLTERVPLAQAAAELPCRRAGKRTHVATLYRWTQRGCRGVRLRYVMVGVTRCTTRQWLNEFFDELTSRAEGPAEASPGCTPAAPSRRPRPSSTAWASERANAQKRAARGGESPGRSSPNH
jgi:hypothetical protein